MKILCIEFWLLIIFTILSNLQPPHELIQYRCLWYAFHVLMPKLLGNISRCNMKTEAVIPWPDSDYIYISFMILNSTLPHKSQKWFSLRQKSYMQFLKYFGHQLTNTQKDNCLFKETLKIMWCGKWNSIVVQ